MLPNTFSLVEAAMSEYSPQYSLPSADPFPSSAPAPLPESAVTPMQGVCEALDQFLAPLLQQLDECLDKRLVRTFARTLHVLLGFGNQIQGLLLSELGAYLVSAQQAPAGTKRLSNLLRSNKWSPALIEQFLWQRACRRQQELEQDSQETLLLWDGSVVEKPESRKREALCPVRSSKAKRLSRPRPGFSGGPPGKPTFVPGYAWLTLLLCGRSGPVTLAAMRWFSTRGPEPSREREVLRPLLQKAQHAWGGSALHLFDRGFAGAPFLLELTGGGVRFLLRWPKRYQLLNAQGERVPAWQITRGKKSWSQRLVREGHTGRVYEAGVLAAPVRHPDLPEVPLWLVVSRPRQGLEPWYLLTSEPVETAEQAWRMVFAYSRRWQVETAFRYNKTELSLESPRLWSLERRTKLMLMLSLLYAFLLLFLLLFLSEPPLQALRATLLETFCKRTGKRSRQATAPLYRLLYRLRWAIARLYACCLASKLLLRQSSG
jgi:hypothetical protein